MPIGRQKKTSKVKTPATPPPITQTVFNAPSGDRFTTISTNGLQSLQSDLSPQTQATVAESLKALQDLAGELHQPDALRQNAIQQRSEDFYQLQAQGINAEADNRLAQTRSDLSKRFGGTYNASFGADLLGNLEKSRLNTLSDARKSSSLLGEDLYQSDEDSKIRRFNVFQNYLTDLNSQARGLQAASSSLIGSEAQRATDIALQRSNLINGIALEDNAQAQENARQRRAQAIQVASQLAWLAV